MCVSAAVLVYSTVGIECWDHSQACYIFLRAVDACTVLCAKVLKCCVRFHMAPSQAAPGLYSILEKLNSGQHDDYKHDSCDETNTTHRRKHVFVAPVTTP